MSSGLSDLPRFVVPRWRSTHATVVAGHLRSLTAAPDRGEPASVTPEEVRAWEPGASPHVGSDILEQLRFDPTRIDELRHVAKRLRQDAALPRGLARAIAEILDPGSIDVRSLNSSEGRRARRLLVLDPANAHGWTDLALQQTLSGSSAAARRSIRTALALAPDDRHVLRSAAALFDHLETPDEGLAALRRTIRLEADPWLMATEIALAQSSGTTPTTLKWARSGLASATFGPHDLAELAAAVATDEVQAGHDKKARGLLKQALTSPTENAVAQAEFESKRARFEIPQEALQSEGAHEARARQALSARDWRLSFDESTEWFDDQPFSNEAASFRSFVASVALEDFPIAISAAQAGLRANPGSAMLLNNLAFAAASDGQFDLASWALDKARAGQPDDREDVFLTATAGLLAFRQGNLDLGRSLYDNSIQRARRVGSVDLVSTAKVFLAREEVLARTTAALSALRELGRLRVADDVTRALILRITEMAALRGLT